MYTVAFYSYRGGVGRTTTLANVAADLAARGRNVLLVDFHLDAPGLANIAPFRPQAPRDGLVEFVAEFQRSNRSPDIRAYCYPVEELEGARGKVSILPAGRCDDAYWTSRSGINWQELYAARDGFFLFEDLKAQCHEHLRPDYVLIDAQAGISDITAICLRQLADAVVMMFVPDEAHDATDDGGTGDVAGFLRVFRDLNLEPGRRMSVILAPCKVPEFEDIDGSVQERIVCYCQDPRVDAVGISAINVIPHWPALLAEKRILAWSSRSSRLEKAYHKLATAVIKANCTQDREGACAFLAQLQQDPALVTAVIDSRSGRCSDYAQQLERLIKNFSRDQEILAQAASCFFLAARYERAMYVLDDALELRPADVTLLWQRASYNRLLGGLKEKEKAASDLLRVLDAKAPPPALPAARETPLKDFLDRVCRGKLIRSPGMLANANESNTYLLRSPSLLPLAHEWNGVDIYIPSTLRALRLLAPDRVEEALNKPCVLALSDELRERLRRDNPAPIPVSAQQFLSGIELISHRLWREAIACLQKVERLPPTEDSFEDCFHLAMAYWGGHAEHNAKSLCQSLSQLLSEKRLLEFLEGKGTALSDKECESFLELSQMMLLIFWQADEVEKCRKVYNVMNHLLPLAPDKNVFSFWRYQEVSRDVFFSDLVSQDYMLKGASIRPVFLDRDPAVS